MVNFFGTLQNEWAGARFFFFDTYLSPFVKKFSMELEEEIKIPVFTVSIGRS